MVGDVSASPLFRLVVSFHYSERASFFSSHECCQACKLDRVLYFPVWPLLADLYKGRMLAAGQLLVFSVWVDVCCGYVDWIFPGPNNPNLTFNYIDIVYFTWASSVEQPYMNLWCSPTPSDPQSKDYRKSSTEGFFSLVRWRLELESEHC